MALIAFTDKGLYCRQGDFYIDPWRGVNRAIITHAHSDHARWGSQYYLCHHQSVPLLKLRLGAQINAEGKAWGETFFMHGVQVSLHPAGHIIGSAQIRVEYKGEVWVVSGDYKLENDGLSESWEPVNCHTFLTESTFGLPVYRWQKQEDIYRKMQAWVSANALQGKSSLFIAYSLGKAQRILAPLSATGKKIYVHGAIRNVQDTLVQAGWKMPETVSITKDTPASDLKGAVVVAPPSAEGSTWMKKFAPYALGICSGWMHIRGQVRRRNADGGFALSDHCDWPSLLTAIKATGASRVFVTHGFQSVLSRYLQESGIESHEVKTAYGQEEETAAEDTNTENPSDTNDSVSDPKVQD